MSAPVVAIIGRPNVGKSTFFNRVLGARRAVVHDRPGITRDRNSARAEWAGRPFVLVDTGGFLPAAAEGRDAVVRRQPRWRSSSPTRDLHGRRQDRRGGPRWGDRPEPATPRRALPAGRQQGRQARRRDHARVHRLGLGDPIPISSEGGLGIGDLLDRLIALFPPRAEPDEDGQPRVAIVGRPNVGKSSIVNALLGEER